MIYLFDVPKVHYLIVPLHTLFENMNQYNTDCYNNYFQEKCLLGPDSPSQYNNIIFGRSIHLPCHHIPYHKMPNPQIPYQPIPYQQIPYHQIPNQQVSENKFTMWKEYVKDNIIMINFIDICNFYIWNIITDKYTRIVTRHTSKLRVICVKDNLIITSSVHNRIHVLDMNQPSGKEYIRALHYRSESIDSICGVPNNGTDNIIISCGHSDGISIICIYDLNRPSGEECIHVFKENYRIVRHITCVNNMLISNSWNNKIRISDLSKNINTHTHTQIYTTISEPIREQNLDDFTVYLFAVIGVSSYVDTIGVINDHRNSRSLIVSESSNSTICIWDIERPSGEECIKVLYGHTKRINSIYIHENIIVSSSLDNTIRIWDINKCINTNGIGASSDECCIKILTCEHNIHKIFMQDNLIILGGQNNIIYPITLFPGEYTLFCNVIDNYLLSINLNHAITHFLH